ncbi:MAG: hypothetical protein ABI644_02660 [Arenimonas sp.]
MLTGDEFSGEEAYRMGFVQHLTEPGEQYTCALNIARTIAKAAPLGVQAALASSRLARSHGEIVALQALMPALPAMMQTEDMHEAIAAFKKKRIPVFQGK